MGTQRVRTVLPLLLLLAGAEAPALAGTATLLRDIYQGIESQDYESGVTGELLSLGEVALVPIDEPSSGRELWVSDGTDAGTRPLLDYCPGGCSSNLSFLGQVRGAGVFQITAEVDSSSTALWRSDGTRPGTFPLAGPAGAPQRCGSGTAATRQSIFLFARTESGCGLWKTNGTSAGTVPVRQIAPDDPDGLPEDLSGLVALGERVFFLHGTWDSRELWRSDGTPSGTIPLHVWTSGHRPSHLIAAGSRLFFLASSGADNGRELWVSDGTPAGTRPVTSFTPAEPFVPRNDFNGQLVIQAVDAQVCFLANDGVTGRELWCSDGTPAGTRRVTDFTLASPFVGLQDWRVEKLGQRLVFPANDGTSGNRLWTTTGQPASTARIDGCPGGCPEVSPEGEPARAGSRLYFHGDRDGRELWVTDGTGAGTRRIYQRICETFCRFSTLTPLFGQLFFTAPDGQDETYLWRTDGSAGGLVRMVRLGSVFYGADGIPYPPVFVGERALLALEAESTDKPRLWSSDGTPEGTRPVTRIGGNGLGSSPQSLVPAGDGVRFLAAGGSDIYGLWASQGTEASTVLAVPFASADRLLPLGSLTIGISSEIWRSDGTPAGTFTLVPGDGSGYPTEEVVLPGRVVFSLQHPDDPRYTLWSTDGTVAGTRKFFDLPAGASYLHSLTAADGKAYFVIGEINSESQLWETDGTAAGTRRLTPQDQLFIDSPLRVARLGSTVFFVGSDDFSGDHLWRADGTLAGTRAVTEGKTQTPGQIVAHQGSLYFFASSAVSPFPSGLWKSDGTTEGTVLLRELPRFDSFSIGQPFTSFGPFLYFVSAGELWRTDGTTQGTVVVRDIVPGLRGSSPEYLTPLGGKLYFSASDREHGRELWETDGTEQGTRPVTDIAPGVFSSDPEELVAAGGKLFFTADDGVHGREPWVYLPTGSGCQASEHALCLGGRFRVEADWRDFEGGSGRGRAMALTADTGYFWFFEPSNIEVILKVLDGQGLNGHHWVFYGALSSVEYTLTVTDTQTGAVRRYINPSGLLGSVADTQAFGPLGASLPGVVTTGPSPKTGEARMSMRSAPATGSCAPSSTRLCLNDGRFAVEARWKDFEGKTGVGRAVPLPGGDTGYFWFFDDDNVEVVLKVLDGRPLNGKFWVFYGALSTVEYTLTVTDTVTGTVKTYTNPSGELASVADTGAF